MAEGARGAQEQALKMLGRRARSEAEVRRGLERKGFAEADIEAAIARLKELRYLDDRAFAADQAKGLLGARRLGPASAVRRLAAAGIAESEAEAAVCQAREGTSEAELARAALEKRRPVVSGTSPLPERLKAARWLMGRGFSEEVARALLQMAEEQDPE